MFTTRPELIGTFGMTASTHWLATAAGMAVLERGGNAFDAACAMGFVLHVAEPHNNGPGGDVPILFARRGEAPQVLCGQGPAPAGATIAHYRAQGIDFIPRSGLLAAVVPGAVPAWLVLLRDHGTWPLADVVAPAIDYAERGCPVVPRVADAVAGSRRIFEEEWPTSAAFWLADGRGPRAGDRYRNPALGRTWRRLVEEAEAGAPGSGSDRRGAVIDRAAELWASGFVAEAIGRFAAQPAGDGLGRTVAGVLTADDLARWRPAYEPAVSYDYGGATVWKCGPWSQGPVLLQCLALLRRFDVDSMQPVGAEFVHLVTEVMKLAYADRDTFYGDPAMVDVPLDVLLSDRYNDGRAALIDPGTASMEYRPGVVPGYGAPLDYPAAVARRALLREWAARVSGEATAAGADAAIADGSGGRPGAPVGTAAGTGRAAAGPHKGDTCHLDVADRWGNVVSATPSGGWLQSSPHIPELGFPLGSRAQMFFLDDAHPSALAPGRRPRTTLTPSLATGEGWRLSFGTPGGDGQDQWQLVMFLRWLGGMNLQEAIDAPAFHSAHWPDSFWPRQAHPGRLIVEDRFGGAVVNELQRLGHGVVAAPPWSEGFLSAVLCRDDGDGLEFRAGANPRFMQGYAAGR